MVGWVDPGADLEVMVKKTSLTQPSRLLVCLVSDEEKLWDVAGTTSVHPPASHTKTKAGDITE
jgi:hypothetical protein